MMLTLTPQERALALTTLHTAGIQGTEADTALATLTRLSNAPTLDTWLTQHQGATPQALTARYGHDSAPAALALTRHLPTPP